MKRFIAAGLMSFMTLSPVMAFAQANNASGTRPTSSQMTKEERLELREERRAEIVAQREERKTELQEKLAGFRDQRRAQLVERINTNIEKLNEVLTTRAAAHIERLTAVLDRIEEADEDNSGDADIAAAEDAIEAATEAMEDQADKVYEFEIADEATVGSVVSAARAELRADLEKMFTAIKDAREAVRKAATHIDARADDDNATSTDDDE